MRNDVTEFLKELVHGPCGSVDLGEYEKYVRKTAEALLKGNLVYVTTMYRYGNRGSHSYIVGVFGSKQLAEIAGNNEVLVRGGKYEPSVQAFVTIDTMRDLMKMGDDE